jgi:hypothetical protein
VAEMQQSGRRRRQAAAIRLIHRGKLTTKTPGHKVFFSTASPKMRMDFCRHKIQ